MSYVECLCDWQTCGLHFWNILGLEFALLETVGLLCSLKMDITFLH